MVRQVKQIDRHKQNTAVFDPGNPTPSGSIESLYIPSRMQNPCQALLEPRTAAEVLKANRHPEQKRCILLLINIHIPSISTTQQT